MRGSPRGGDKARGALRLWLRTAPRSRPREDSPASPGRWSSRKLTHYPAHGPLASAGARGYPRCMARGSRIVPIEEALEEIRAGRIIVLMDDEDRENEGDLCVAAERVTAEHVNFMATHGRGLVCLALGEEQCDQLGLAMMVTENRAPLGTAFTVSIDARHGIGRGISAVDRATTIRTAIRPDATPADIVSPGHVFPLRARRGGVLVRAGQTEGAVDLARLAGFSPAGVICEILRDDR